MCSLATARRRATFIVDETLSAAEADSEMAYRLATYFALEGDESEALHWLRRAIYLGNENYPWFSINPAWRKLGGHADFERILEDLKKVVSSGIRRTGSDCWRRLGISYSPPPISCKIFKTFRLRLDLVFSCLLLWVRSGLFEGGLCQVLPDFFVRSEE